MSRLLHRNILLSVGKAAKWAGVTRRIIQGDIERGYLKCERHPQLPGETGKTWRKVRLKDLLKLYPEVEER